MKLIERNEYVAWLKSYKDKPLIKVVTGLRRVGKSTIFDLYIQELKKEGISDEQILKINFEDLDNEPLRDKRALAHSKDFQNRIEKVLPLLSGYISAMFSQYISKRLKSSPCEAFTFDARIIILPTSQLKDYFHSRQAFAMSGFIDRICSFKHLTPISRTFSNVKQALKDIGDDWFNYPQYVCSGYVGRYENEKWTVDTASDFMQKWYKYEKNIGV